MRNALIIGSSGGIGGALLAECAARGYQVAGLSRSDDGFDVTDAASVEHHLAALSGPYHLILVATGALEVSQPPEKSLKALSAEALAEQFAINTIGPALILRHAPRLMPRDQPGVFAALSARVGSIEDNRLGGWYSYRAAKAALNQILKCGAIEMARTHRQARVLALHPGTVATDFTANYVKSERATPPKAAAQNLMDVVESKAETAGFYDYAGARIPW